MRRSAKVCDLWFVPDLTRFFCELLRRHLLSQTLDPVVLWATRRGYRDCLEALIRAGASIDVEDVRCRETDQPVQSMLVRGRVPQCLPHCSRSAFLEQDDCLAPLHIAASMGHTACVRLLLDSDSSDEFVDRMNEVRCQQRGQFRWAAQSLSRASSDAHLRTVASALCRREGRPHFTSPLRPGRCQVFGCSSARVQTSTCAISRDCALFTWQRVAGTRGV